MGDKRYTNELSARKNRNPEMNRVLEGTGWNERARLFAEAAPATRPAEFCNFSWFVCSRGLCAFLLGQGLQPRIFTIFKQLSDEMRRMSRREDNVTGWGIYPPSCPPPPRAAECSWLYKIQMHAEGSFVFEGFVFPANS